MRTPGGLLMVPSEGHWHFVAAFSTIGAGTMYSAAGLTGHGPRLSVDTWCAQSLLVAQLFWRIDETTPICPYCGATFGAELQRTLGT